ncbi:MAG: chloride channel protein [Acidimicrobiales bacterium]
MAELRALALRSREVVAVSALIGVGVGLAVALFEQAAAGGVLERVLEAPVWVQVAAPAIGLLLSATALRFLTGSPSQATTDVYIQAMPDPRGPFPLRPVLGRLTAAFATLGFGGSAGFEGPSIYLGAGMGAAVHERLSRRLRGLDRHMLLAAGAAAGVAAIFKAPATGAVFALEVPYQHDLARGTLLPALVGAASGYTTYVALEGTAPLIPVDGSPPIDLRDLAAAAVVGIVCGFGARIYAYLVRQAKRAQDLISPWWRAIAAGAGLAGLVVVSRVAFEGEPLSLGPGYGAIDWALDPDRTIVLIAALATVRALATILTIGGGVGGLFVPLVVQGALSGRLVSEVFGGEHQSLFVVVGIAAFLGAGYRVPLAAVMFVAEATGRPGFVVPGLIAAVLAELVMGDSSVSPYQRRRHRGHLEERADLPVAQALVTDTGTAAPDDTISQFFAEHVAMARRRAVPVVDDGQFLGMVELERLLDVDHDAWPTTTLREVVPEERVEGSSDWTLGQALAAMVDADVDHLAIVSEEGRFLGMVTRASILDLQDLLDHLEDDRPTP